MMKNSLIVMFTLFVVLLLASPLAYYTNAANVEDYNESEVVKERRIDGGEQYSNMPCLNCTVKPFNVPFYDFETMFIGQIVSMKFAISYRDYNDSTEESANNIETITGPEQSAQKEDVTFVKTGEDNSQDKQKGSSNNPTSGGKQGLPYILDIEYTKGQPGWLYIDKMSGVLDEHGGGSYGTLIELIVNTVELENPTGYYIEDTGPRLVGNQVVDGYRYSHEAEITGQCNGETATGLIRIDIEQRVGVGSGLEYSPKEIHFDSSTNTKKVQIWNSGEGEMTYHLYTWDNGIKINGNNRAVSGPKEIEYITLDGNNMECNHDTIISREIHTITIDVTNMEWPSGLILIDTNSHGIGSIKVYRDGEYNDNNPTHSDETNNDNQRLPEENQPITDDPDWEIGKGEDDKNTPSILQIIFQKLIKLIRAIFPNTNI